jgi:hypothetical protein
VFLLSDCGDEGKSGRIPADLAARFVSLIPPSDPGSGPDVWLPVDVSCYYLFFFNIHIGNFERYTF